MGRCEGLFRPLYFFDQALYLGSYFIPDSAKLLSSQF